MKILLADDHTLFRDIVMQYLLSTGEYAEVLLAENFSEGKQKIEDNLPLDMVILDLKMPGMNGLNGLSELIALYQDLPIAIMSGVAKPNIISEALEMGAVGYFPKTMTPKDMLAGIKAVMSGEKFVPTCEKTSTLMPSFYNDVEHNVNIDAANDVNLTPREKEVLGYLAKGASNKEIANQLGLQLVTIKLHVRGICRKLGADNRTQAAIKARDLSLVS